MTRKPMHPTTPPMTGAVGKPDLALAAATKGVVVGVEDGGMVDEVTAGGNHNTSK